MTDSDDVLVASTVSGPQTRSSSPNTPRLSSDRSGTASTTSWQSASWDGSVVKVIRSRRACCSSADILPRSTARPVDCDRCPLPCSSAAPLTSTPTTPTPVRASTSAMPAPIVPRPTTPTLVNSRATACSPRRRPDGPGLSPVSLAASWQRNGSPLSSPPVRLVIARCRVDYAGRLTAHLPLALRLILVKADGSVSIHADDRAYKPLNWMSPPCELHEADGVWTVSNRAGEQLVVTIDEVVHDSSHVLGVDPGLRKDGVEAHLQELLAARPEVLGPGLTLVRRGHPTAIGPVDLLLRAATGGTVAVEVKRRGDIDGV